MKERVYMVMDWADKKATEIKGEMIGCHFSSTLDFLRYDLTNKLDNPEEYEIVDLIGQECPERFKRKEAPK
jgi:hypothetical protein